MALPQTVRVKLSSDAAGAISLTPVVVQELPIRDLLEHLLAMVGKDEMRLREILLRGTLVSGGSRFRWTGWDPDPAGLAELLATFPDPDPARTFAAQHCMRAVLRGGRGPVEIPREAASKRALFRRTTFWEVLMEVVSATDPVYANYSYRDRADHYLCDLPPAAAARLRSAGAAVRYTTLRDRIQSGAFVQVELHVIRPAG